MTAAVLCSFVIPETQKNFLAYTLNEEVNETDARAYMTSLLKEGDSYTLGVSISDEDAQMAMFVFSQTLREAMTGKRRTSDIHYHLLDLTNQVVLPAPLKEHHSFNIEKEWAVKLLGFEPSVHFGPAIELDATIRLGDSETEAAAGEFVEHALVRLDNQEDMASACGDIPCRSETREIVVSPPESGSTYEEATPSIRDTSSYEAEQFLRDVQTTLETFSTIALKLTQQTSLESRELRLQGLELLLGQKQEQLLLNQQRDDELLEQYVLREAELNAREETLDRKTKELSEQLKQLSATKKKLNDLFDGFDVSTN